MGGIVRPDDDGKDHRRRADHGSTNKHGFRRRLERIPGAVIFLEMLLGPFELGIETEVFLISAAIPGICSIVDNSYTDCALSVRTRAHTRSTARK